MTAGMNHIRKIGAGKGRSRSGKKTAGPDGDSGISGTVRGDAGINGGKTTIRGKNQEP